MKKMFFLLLLCAAANLSFAQKGLSHPTAGASNPRLDKMETDGFTIVLKPAVRNTFLFSVYQKGTLLHTAIRSPVSQSAVGFSSRQDAFRAAGWMIGMYQQNGLFPETIPAHTAHSLQLTTANQ